MLISNLELLEHLSDEVPFVFDAAHIRIKKLS